MPRYPCCWYTPPSGCNWSSYDQRNIFGLLPALALCVSFGGAWLWRARPQVIWPNVIAVVAGLFLILAGGGLLKDAQARLASLTGGERALPARLRAMRGGIAGKLPCSILSWIGIPLHFPLAGRTDAAHVLVTYPLFRFFERGAHALSLWPFDRVRPGDVFASHEYHVPPGDPRWVLLSRSPGNRVWLRVSDLRLVSPRRAEPSSGGTTRILYDVEPADLGHDGLVVWQAAGAEEQPGHRHLRTL